MATCRDILNNSSDNKLRLIGGKNGLDRVITWHYTILVRPLRHWINGGELAFYYGAGMDNSEKGLINLIHEAYEANLAGLILIQGDTYVIHIPQSVIDVANQYNFPLFVIDRSSYISTFQQNIVSFITNAENRRAEKSEFWKTLFFNETGENNRELVNKAYYFNIDPFGHYCAYIIRFHNLEEYLEQTKSFEHTFYVNDFLNGINKKAEYFMASKVTQVWTLPRQKDLIIVYHVTQTNTIEKMNLILSDICKKLESVYPGAKFIVGKGLTLKDVAHIRKSYIQAIRALYVRGSSDEQIYSYADIGCYKILFEVNSKSILEEYIKDNIDVLLQYDEKYNASLFETLQLYLTHRGNIAKTASALYLHRNTINLRLSKIESLLHIDLNNNEDFYNLQLSMQIYCYLCDYNTEESYIYDNI